MRILPAILFVLSGSAFALTFKPFKVGVGFGPVVSISGRFAAGFLMYVEPSYRILMLDYNFIQSVQRKSVSDPTAKLISYHNVMPGYFSLKLGWTIGGGRITGKEN